MNIAIINQGCGRYLFEVPANIALKEGDRVKCDTRKGITDGVVFCDSAEVEESAAKLIGKLLGAKFPLKSVVGKTVTSVEMFEQPKREPAKLYCVAESHPGKRLTKGKIYKTDANGYITYDDGTTSTYEHGSDGWKNNITGISSRLVPLVSRPAEVGEWIYIKNKIGGSGYGVGDIGKVEKLSFFHGNVCAFGGEYIDRMEYLVLDGYKPEPEPEKAEPEYYSGKVVCVAGSNGFTVGKPYEFKNGVVVDDDGDVRPSNGDRKITSLSDTYLRDWENKFIEFKGE